MKMKINEVLLRVPHEPDEDELVFTKTQGMIISIMMINLPISIRCYYEHGYHNIYIYIYI